MKVCALLYVSKWHIHCANSTFNGYGNLLTPQDDKEYVDMSRSKKLIQIVCLFL